MKCSVPSATANTRGSSAGARNAFTRSNATSLIAFPHPPVRIERRWLSPRQQQFLQPERCRACGFHSISRIWPAPSSGTSRRRSASAIPRETGRSLESAAICWRRSSVRHAELSRNEKRNLRRGGGDRAKRRSPHRARGDRPREGNRPEQVLSWPGRQVHLGRFRLEFSSL